MDRRVLLAVVLMMAIAMLPAVLFKRPAPRPVRDTTGPATVATPQAAQPPAPATIGPAVPADTMPAEAPEQIVRVTSPLFTYGLSTRGGRLVEATLARYQSMAPGESDQPAELVPDRSHLLGLRLVTGADTLSLSEWTFTPTTDTLSVAAPGESVTLTAARGEIGVEMTFRFTPENYLITVDGRVSGLGPNGGVLLIGLGPTLRNTESDSLLHQTELAIVTKGVAESEKTRFQSLDRDVTTEFNGPFDWVALKSKYFVTALFAVDSSSGTGTGRISGLRARPTDTRRRPAEADLQAGLPVTSAGTFRYALYAGPMEYPRLRGMGHDFYDVNPYGWPGFRTIIRPVAVAGRWLLVKMHDLGIAYGWGLVLFGILVRVALWPLNQKAMRASIRMQAVQPLMKDLQDRYKNDPQKLQQEMFKLYKEHDVNPLGGCWPMLVPMPILFALFFVFQNTIELRGAPFLWLADLSRPDPLYIIPVLMGLSMYLVSKIGQMGMTPTPQMKMMLYVMPVMLTVMFVNFASGLNLYYAVQNLASVPQQWLIARERMKTAPVAAGRKGGEAEGRKDKPKR